MFSNAGRNGKVTLRSARSIDDVGGQSVNCRYAAISEAVRTKHEPSVKITQFPLKLKFTYS